MRKVAVFGGKGMRKSGQRRFWNSTILLGGGDHRKISHVSVADEEAPAWFSRGPGRSYGNFALMPTMEET